jgi:hypothetical protein
MSGVPDDVVLTAAGSSASSSNSAASAEPSVETASTTTPTTPVSHFLTSFWAALKGPVPSPALTSGLAVQRLKVGSAFVNALMECLVLLLRRGKDNPALFSISGDETEAKTIAKEEVQRILSVVDYGAPGPSGVTSNAGVLKVEAKELGGILVKGLSALDGIDPEGGLFQESWGAVYESIMEGKDTRLMFISGMLWGMYDGLMRREKYRQEQRGSSDTAEDAQEPRDRVQAKIEELIGEVLVNAAGKVLEDLEAFEKRVFETHENGTIEKEPPKEAYLLPVLLNAFEGGMVWRFDVFTKV